MHALLPATTPRSSCCRPCPPGTPPSARSSLPRRRRLRLAATTDDATQQQPRPTPPDAPPVEPPAVELTWMERNDALLRASPLYLGVTVGVLLVIVKFSSGSTALAAASSAARAEVLVLVMCATLILTGLNWITVAPRAPVVVPMEGVPVSFTHPRLSEFATTELLWAADTLRRAAGAGAVAAFYRGRRVLQTGLAPLGSGDISETAPVLGSIVADVRTTGKGNYLANLSLYPGRKEFESYIPANAQALLVQPLGEDGVLVVAGDTQRGFTPLDLRYISDLADKLDSTLDGEAWMKEE